MAKRFSSLTKAVLVTENTSAAPGLVVEISAVIPCEFQAWSTCDEKTLSGASVIIFDLNLNRTDIVQRLKTLVEALDPNTISVASVPVGNFTLSAQANSLGISKTVARPVNVAQIISTILSLNPGQKPEKKEPIALASEACVTIADLMDELTINARSGQKLPLAQMEESCAQTIDFMTHSSMDTWLGAVKSHSSYTYRHVMIVTGFAALFGVRFGITKPDIEMLTLGALLHDIGKVFVPGRILDKPGKLTEREMELVRQHPVKGAELLAKDGRFSPEIIKIVRNHHELLDGSGYPDKLAGSEISDLVRVMTVVDIFSALVETRTYKAAMSMEKAYETLKRMGPKLDQDVVRGFEPIALDDNNHEFLKRVRGKAA